MSKTQIEWWTQVFESLQEASSVDQLKARATWLVRDLGFVWFSYGMRRRSAVAGSDVEVLDTYPHEWMKHYVNCGYAAVDPTILAGMNSDAPVVWSEALFRPTPRLWAEARSCSLKFGVAQSTWSSGAFGLLSVARDHDALSDAEAGHLTPKLKWVAHNLHQRYQSLRPPDVNHLSSREHEVLSWTADGKTAWEIARILGISPKTVNFHIGNILFKLDAQNKVQAVSKASTMGLLPRDSARM